MTQQATQIDRSSPIAYKYRLGTRLEDLQAQYNLLLAAVNRIYLRNAFLLTAPVLAIKAGGSVTAMSTGAFSAMAAGVIQSKAANTDMAAISGTVADTKSALWAFYIDSAGTLSASTKTADAASAAAALLLKPAIPANKVELGYIIVTNASAAPFVAATTALDATGVTTTYVNSTAIAATTGATAVTGLD